MYTEAVLDHFNNPRNVGIIDDPTVLVQVGDPGCGDSLLLTLKIEDDRLIDIRYKIYGCGAAIATSSMGSELVKGKTLSEALAVGDADVIAALGGLPEEKEHCSNLIASALQAGIRQYLDSRRQEEAK
ncbi:MAG: iron-sulfur cluster assembly scaffold protein [Desulfuromonadales bacterium]